MKKRFRYGEDLLTTGKALAIARGEIQGVLESETRRRISVSHLAVEKIADGDHPVYGINTGFGPLCQSVISSSNTKELQRRLLISHSVGVGEPVSIEISRLMLILKVHALAQGFSGIAVEVLDRIIWHIDHNITPVVPEQGSVGASGDLAPLSHLFLPLIGEGEVWENGKKIPVLGMLRRHQLSALELGPKSGLALINGTQFIAAHAVSLVEKLHGCLTQSDIIAAMMLEGLLGSRSPFMKELHQLRPYKGNRHVAQRIQQLLSSSEILASHKDCGKVQDPYSLRCIPQVHGASRNAWLHLKEMVEVEINSVTDNPIVFSSELTISGGNFHGQPLALPIDYACLAAAELGNISDRRIYLSLEGKREGTPKLLMQDTGLNSGFMIVQYTSASLVSENKGLCFPASADSIPTSLGQEDHVSMGSIGGRKALRVCDNLIRILGIELLCAAQAFDFRRPLRSSPLLEAAHEVIRQHIDFADADRIFSRDINAAIEFVKNRLLLKAVVFEPGEWDELFENY